MLARNFLTWEILAMSATIVREKRHVAIPAEVFGRAGLRVNDLVDWRFEDGEIRGRRLPAKESPERFPPGSLVQYMTPERDELETALMSGCMAGPE
jgi:hypothetical protein